MEDSTYTTIAMGMIAATASIFLVTQIHAVALEKPMLMSQRDSLNKRLISFTDAIIQADETIQTRESQLRKASATESKYAALLTELLEIAKTDFDARAVAQKWKIQQGGTDKAAESPAASAQPVAPSVPEQSKGAKTPVPPKGK